MLKTVIMIMALITFMPRTILAEDWGVIKQADTVVNIRKERSHKSRITCRLKPGYRVKVDFLEGKWWAVFKLSETSRDEGHALGYVYAPLLQSVAGSSMSIMPAQQEEGDRIDR